MTFAIAFSCAAQNNPRLELRPFIDSAMRRDGNASRGKELFGKGDKTACINCHTVDGSGNKAGPDLSSIGDKFPRRELITAVLEPSASIAVGYGSTAFELKSAEQFSGVIKQTTDTFVEFAGGDGKLVRLQKKEIANQRDLNVSLMPEGLQAAMSTNDFTDLIEYLVSLKQPDSAVAHNRGTPVVIPDLAKPVEVRPFFSESLRFPHSVASTNSVRAGLTWFGQIPGVSNLFLVIHESGKMWTVEKKTPDDTKTLFADLSSEIFSKRGPNGLLSIAFHPKFRQNRKYYLNHQILEDGKIVCTVVEREVSADFRTDSGKPSRLLWKVGTSTQDHTGGGIGFGPDGFLYIAMGDTGPQRDPQGHGQNMTMHLGKMLRIDVDHQEPGMAYAIPADNPFRGRSDVRPEIWASGFREPWRFSFDSVTGDLWVGDVGQDRIEEVDIVRRGENYGWNVYEGFEPYSNQYRKEGMKYTPPVFAYTRKYGFSITGGFVYRGDKRSSFYGVYVCGDYQTKRIWGLTQRDRTLDVIRQIGTCPESISSFGTDDAGNIYAIGYEGMVFKIDLASSEFH